MAQDKGRSEIQKKTFTRWINTHLSDRQLEIKDLSTDLADGTKFLHLLEIISGKRIRKWKKNPKLFAQKLENLNKGLKFIKDEGITIVNIGANDINGGNLKIILGLIWTLILRYQINKENYEPGGGRISSSSLPSADDGSKKKDKKKKDKKNQGKKELLNWVNSQLSPYKQSVKNFKNDWKDPNILCALTNSLQPGLMDLDKIADDANAEDTARTRDIQEAMSKAETHFGIPQVMDASDMAVLPDELSVMTYVSYYRDKAHELEKKAKAGGKSYAEGSGLETGVIQDGEPREFTVHCLTHEGQPMKQEEDEKHIVKVVIKDPDNNNIDCEIIDPTSSTHPEQYHVKYLAQNPGTYSITISVKDAVLKGYPKEIILNPSSSSEIKSCEFSFTIYAANEDGEPETEGGDLFEVELKNEKGEIFEVFPTDNGDGTYTAKYNLYHGHLYKVFANLNGEPIANSPFIHDMRNDVDKSTYVY